MKQLFYDLFGQGSKLSMVRLESLIVVITACYLAISKGPDELGVITVLLSTGFTAKVLQKNIEVKANESTDNIFHDKRTEHS